MQLDHIINSEYLADQQYKRIECPACSPHRKKKNQKTLSLTRDSDKILYQCWHCQLSGVVNMNQTTTTTKKITEPTPISVAKEITPSSGVVYNKHQIKFLKDRGISEDTAKKYGVYFDSRGFNGVGNATGVGFPYYKEDKVYAVKWRTLEGKNFTQEGSARTFFGLDKININELIVICEGEFDALALAEAGIEGAVSVPIGAVMKVKNKKIYPS